LYFIGRVASALKYNFCVKLESWKFQNLLKLLNVETVDKCEIFTRLKSVELLGSFKKNPIFRIMTKIEKFENIRDKSVWSLWNLSNITNLEILQKKV
jgi:hypothetical protein